MSGEIHVFRSFRSGSTTTGTAQPLQLSKQLKKRQPRSLIHKTPSISIIQSEEIEVCLGDKIEPHDYR